MSSSLRFTALIASALALGLAPPARGRASAGEDLGKRYPATLTWSQFGLTAECRPEDVFELKSFAFEFGKDLQLSCKQAVVALGHHEKNVLWAAVFPQEPPELRSAVEGQGEHAATIFLRFAPAELDALFPKATVKKGGDAWRRVDALRLARHKVTWKWCTPAGNSTVVPQGITIVDIDTTEGGRRMFVTNRAEGTIEYVTDYEDAPLPPSPPIGKAEALAAFDEVHAAFDRTYAGFVLLPKLDWAKHGKALRKQAAGVANLHQLGAVIADTLAALEDLHVWVKVGDDFMPGYTRDRPLNGNWKATQAAASASRRSGDDLVWGRTEDGIGYLGVHGLTDRALPDHVDAALEKLGDTWGLVVDLRFNGGGGEDLGAAVAGRFLDEERVYSLNRYRSGEDHDDLGPLLQRKAAPRGPWRYESPVVLLQGQRTMSSAESLALMFAQCPQVTTMGDRTAGSSANPTRLELECGVTVNLPRWLDMDPEERPIEHVGVAPEVALENDPAAFTDDSDPVIEAALTHLRRTKAGAREPGRRP